MRARPRARRIVGRRLALALFAMIVVVAPTAEAGLRSAPYDLEVSPSTVHEGQRLGLDLAPNGGIETIGPHDLYVWFLTDGGKAWSYLSPSGQWQRQAVAYRKVHRRADARPVRVPLDRLPPPGWYSVGVLMVAPGAPPARKHYVARPIVVRARVRPAVATTPAEIGGLVGLAALCLAGVGVVWRYPTSASGD
jgi:hypothetical protein